MKPDTTALLAQLAADGFRAALDDDGDIAFTCEGMHYTLVFDAGDPQFSKLILPNVWQLDTQDEFNRALVALDDINRRLKLVKGHTARDQVWLGIELWMADAGAWPLLLPRAIRALAHALHLLTGHMRTAAPALADRRMM